MERTNYESMDKREDFEYQFEEYDDEQAFCDQTILDVFNEKLPGRQMSDSPSSGDSCCYLSSGGSNAGGQKEGPGQGPNPSGLGGQGRQEDRQCEEEEERKAHSEGTCDDGEASCGQDGHQFVIDFYNITTWGVKSKDYFLDKEYIGDVAGIGEHHMRGNDCEKMKRDLQQGKWRSCVSEAVPSGRSERGTSGGTAIISRAHLHLTPFRGDAESQHRLGNGGGDWSAIQIRLRGVTILFIALYLTCGAGVSGPNARKLREVMELTIAAGFPFLIMADWNMKPSQLQESRWLQKIGGQVCLPRGVGHTCSTGSLLDYAVVGNGMQAALLDLRPVLAVPWKSHVGLRACVRRAPRAALCRRLIRPKPLFNINNVGGCSACDINGRVNGRVSCHSIARIVCRHCGNTGKHYGCENKIKETDSDDSQEDPKKVGKKSDCIGAKRDEDKDGTPQPFSVRYPSPSGLDSRQENSRVVRMNCRGSIQGQAPLDIAGTVIGSIDKDAEEIGSSYAKWSKEAEEYLAGLQGRSPHRTETGRGQFPVFRIGPAFKKTPVHCCSGGDDEVKLWSSIAGRLNDLLKTLRRDNAAHQKKTYIDFLSDYAAKKVDEINQKRFKEGKVRTTAEDFETLLWARRLRAIGGLSQTTIGDMAKDAETKKKKAEAKRAKVAGAKAKNWAIQACNGSAKEGHRYIKAHERSSEDHDEVVNGVYASSPIETMEIKKERWADIWKADDDEEKLLAKVFDQIRDKAKQKEDELDMKIADIKKMMYELNDERVLGIDSWAPKEWQALPDHLLERLCRLVNDMDSRVVVPKQVLTNIIALIPKPTGGDRPVCLSSLIYVLWSRARASEFHDWDTARAQFWDDAIQGSSALKAALCRRLLDECCVAEGGKVAAIYWDIEKFFDSINPRRLMELCEQQGMNLKILAMAAQVHLAPRVLKSFGFMSVPTGVSRGILAGCRFSLGFARSSVYWILEKANNVSPHSLVRQFVDDLAQVTRGDHFDKIVNETTRIGEDLVNDLYSDGFKMSGKSVVVCSDASMQTKICKKLADKGIRVKSHATTKDLGIDATAGSRRTTTHQKKRNGKAARRSIRLKWLKKHTRKARKLYASNLWPVMAYGVSGFGASPTVVKKMRTIAGTAALGARGQCVTTAIALELGECNDPAITTRAIVIADFAWLWKRADGAMRARMRNIWNKALPKLHTPSRWKRAKGPLTALICTLIDIGFNPMSPDCWTDPQGEEWRFNDELAEMNVKDYGKQILKFVGKNLWEKAGEHRNGGGLQGGADLTVLKRHIEHLEENGMKGKAGMLRKAACAAIWPLQRIHAAGCIDSPICHRCGNANEDDFHRIWECEANEELFKDMDYYEQKKMRRLELKAKESKGADEVLWTRGIVPKRLTQCEPPLVNSIEVNVTDDDMTAGTYYLDGSGGVHTSDPRRMRCGWATIKVDYLLDKTPVPVQGVFGTLAGERQNVPRAELTAAVETMRRLGRKPGDVTLVSDCKSVTDGFYKRIGGAAIRGKNSDLWIELIDLAKKRQEGGGEVRFVKVKAHVQDWHLDHGFISWEDFGGNEFADAFAKKGAWLHQVDHLTSGMIDRLDKQAWAIQDRIIATNIAAIEANTGHKKIIEDFEDQVEHKEAKIAKKEDKVDELLDKSSHEFFAEYSVAKEAKTWKCKKCLVTKKDKGFCKWLSKNSSCSAKDPSHSMEGWIDTSCWLLLKDWARSTIEDEEGPGQSAKEERAKEAVASCGALWDEVALKAINFVLKSRTTAVLEKGGGLNIEAPPLHKFSDLGAFEELEGDEAGHPHMAKSVPVGFEIAPSTGTAKEDEVDLEDENFHYHEEEMETFHFEEEEDPFGLGPLDIGGGAGEIVNDAAHALPVTAEEVVVAEPPKVETARERLNRLRATLAARSSSSSECGKSLRASQFAVGNLALHDSHKVHHRRGVLWCWHCAAYSTEALKHLSKPCAGRPGRGAQQFLERLKAGNPPRKGMDWPMAEGSGLPSGPVVFN